MLLKDQLTFWNVCLERTIVPSQNVLVHCECSFVWVAFHYSDLMQSFKLTDELNNYDLLWVGYSYIRLVSSSVNTLRTVGAYTSLIFVVWLNFLDLSFTSICLSYSFILLEISSWSGSGRQQRLQDFIFHALFLSVVAGSTK